MREWLFWEFDRLAPNVYRPRAIKRGFMKADDNVYQLYTGLANDALKVLEASLAKSAFLVGSEADGGRRRGLWRRRLCRRGRHRPRPYANVKAWMGRIEKLPGFKKYEDVLPKQDAA